MKVNEAPERIYISSIPSILGGYVYTTVDKDFPNAVEYIRTDAFIEKACVFIRNNIDKQLTIYYNNTWRKRDEFIDEFRKYMEGE